MRWIERKRRALEAWAGPVGCGIFEGIGFVAGISSFFAIAAFAAGIGDPSVDLLYALAEVLVGLTIAFSVATAGVGLRAGKGLSDHLNWLGYGCGIGLAGLVGIGLSLALAAYREAGHASALDILGICWIGAAALMLGLVVALLPYASYVWSQPLVGSAPDDGQQGPQRAENAPG